MTEEQEAMDEALVKLIEMADFLVLEVKGKKIAFGGDIHADIVRIMRAGLEAAKPTGRFVT